MSRFFLKIENEQGYSKISIVDYDLTSTDSVIESCEKMLKILKVRIENYQSHRDDEMYYITITRADSFSEYSHLELNKHYTIANRSSAGVEFVHKTYQSLIGYLGKIRKDEYYEQFQKTN